MKIVVINKVDYKEKDVIVTALSEDKKISFLVRGCRNATNPFSWLTNPLTVADVTFVEGKYKYPILKNAAFISSPMSKENNFDKMITINLIVEVVEKYYSPELNLYFYKTILSFNNIFEKNKIDYTLIDVFYLFLLLRIEGFEYKKKECMVCGKVNDIVGFSFDTGFICSDCINQVQSDCSLNETKAIENTINITRFSDLADLYFEDDVKKSVLHKTAVFLDDVAGIDLKTLKYILK